MAQDTPLAWRNLVIYEVFVRNHGPHGTFADVEADLPRIREMGVDVVWLMPIHPIGKLDRKGSLGSPYSIVDYQAVNTEYGSKADFRRLIDRAHALGLKVMMDVVFNHTAHDSVLVREHPEWFHQDENGQPISTVLDWTDIIDLRHSSDGLAAYLIDTLRGWAQFGVDGFRCDVASLVPIDFWLAARQAVAEVKPGVIWLAESVHAAFVAARRAAGLVGQSDSELYRAFDMAYDYDIWPIWQAVVAGQQPLRRYLTMVRFQESIYPVNYIKMRCVENHDHSRVMAIAPSRAQAMAWTAFAAFNRGSFLIYAGQEAGASRTPSLFDVDRIAWGDYELQPFLTTLAHLKKDVAQVEGHFSLLSADPVIQAAWHCEGRSLYGVFNTSGAEGAVAVRLADGSYADLLSGEEVTVRYGQMPVPTGGAYVLRHSGSIELTPFFSTLLDYQPALASGMGELD